MRLISHWLNKGQEHKMKKEENFKIIKDIVLNKTVTVELYIIKDSININK